MSRDRVKEVAAAAFAEHGYHATSLRQIAGSAGMTLGTLYHYFPSKEQLLLELIDDAMAPLMDSIPRVEDEAIDDPPAALRWMIREFVVGMLRQRGTAVVSDTELRSLEGRNRALAVAKRDRYQAAMEGVVRAGIDRGVFHVGDVKLTVYAILAMCSGILRWYRPEGRASSSSISRTHEELALRMVGYGDPGAIDPTPTLSDLASERRSPRSDGPGPAQDSATARPAAGSVATADPALLGTPTP